MIPFALDRSSADPQSDTKKDWVEEALRTLRRPTTLPQRPLLYSAFVSVLILLVSQKLTSKSKPYTDWEMLQVRNIQLICHLHFIKVLSQDGITLGLPNVGPILKAERELWAAIFRVAAGDMSVRDAVAMLLKRLPFDRLASLSDNDDQALKLGMTTLSFE